MKKRSPILFVLALTLCVPALAQNNAPNLSDVDFSALELRNIGPAFTSGRIADIALDPVNDNIWYIAVGSGGVWKTENSGTTWKSVFDGQGSYSIGAITLDPNNRFTVWVGTGENVGGRHVGYGDGIYRSTDSGETWTNMGLTETQHISRIIVHPEDSNTLFVAAQGPLWNPGDERGLYKSVDGGESWYKTLGDDEWVGVTEVVMDPKDPDVLYAATWQRHRNVAAYMGGGPGSGVHKSTDGGETWIQLTEGLPESNLGKIGLAISFHNSDHIFAAIEEDRSTGGVYMSRDRGASWTKMSNAVAGATGPHYYQEIYASPHFEGRLYLMDARMQVSEDFGRTFTRMNERTKHGDNHAIAFRENDPNYVLFGSDGGLFESFDDTKTWHFIENMPITQYYKVAVDDSEPFYMVYGGTQDNGSHGGPSRTANRHGIRNSDWFKVLGADGHQSAVEPGNPNILYAETQQGGLHRIDLITGEQVYVQPQSREGEPFERYNWDAPIVVSPHSPSTLYFASYRVWKSTNRGDSWTPISEDLTRNQERFELPIMGRIQSWDNAWDLGAMSVYNTITSLAESSLQPGLLYVGTDDGIIQISEDDGGSWHRVEVGSIRSIPETAFVNNLYADLHDSNVVYAALDNHKYGDLKPYLIKSTDRGRSWQSIASNLPDRTLVWRIVQDHVNPDLLFTATEFGIYFTVNGGGEWINLEGGSPTISFRDITIQRRENDLVAATFGRGFFILDDYAPLRDVSEEMLAQDATLFPAKDAWLYYARDMAGSAQGGSYFTAPNPPFGATFTYYLREGSISLEDERRAIEEDAGDRDLAFPGWNALEAEQNEISDKVEVVVSDAAGKVVARVDGGTDAGFHRVSWDLRFASQAPIDPGESSGSSGFLATPGRYSAMLVMSSGGNVTELSGPIEFSVVPLQKPALEGASARDILSYQEEVNAFQEEVATFYDALDDQVELIDAMSTALARATAPSADVAAQLHDARETLLALEVKVRGYRSKSEAGERNLPSIQSRLSVGMRGLGTMYGPTQMHREALATGKSEFGVVQAELERFMKNVVPGLKSAVEASGAPVIME